MNYSFYRFTNMEHVIQPKNSYWCWAACAEKMIKGLGSKTKIGTTKCQIVSYYKNHILSQPGSNENPNNQLQLNTCCNESEEVNDHCNIGLKDQHLNNIFSLIGFDCEESYKISNLKEIDFIIEQLEENDSPIILKLSTSLEHMVLISGYGEKNGCKYVFIGDPAPGYGEKYIRFDLFIKEYITSSKISKYWISKVKKVDFNKKNIQIDPEIPDDPIEFEKVFNSNFDQIDAIRSSFKNTIKFMAEDLSMESSMLNENIPENWMDFTDQELTICFKKIPLGFYREANLLRDIRNKILESEEISDLSIINFNDFFTTVVARENKGATEVKPVSFPLNYKLKEEWQDYKEFYSILQTMPKGVFFEK